MTGLTWPATDAPLPSISKDDAEELFAELVRRYQDPLFQISLTKLFCNVNPRRKDYNSQLNNLLRPVRDDLLAKYNLPTGFLGDVALALALGDLQYDADLDYLLAQIDESLYVQEAHIISGSQTLKKKEVIKALRMMVFAFRNPDFHRTMISLKAASMVTGKNVGYSLDGRSKLALEKQSPILAKCQLPPNGRGLHMFLHMAAQYIMDPDVAALIAATNTLCGLDVEECKEFNNRLQDISLHDPCPRAVDPQAATKARIRALEASLAARRPPRRRSYAVGALDGVPPPSKPVKPRRNSAPAAVVAKAAPAAPSAPPASAPTLLMSDKRVPLLATRRASNPYLVPDTNVYGNYQYSTDPTNRRTGTISKRSAKLEIAMFGDDAKSTGPSQVLLPRARALSTTTVPEGIPNPYGRGPGQVPLPRRKSTP